MKGGFLTLVSSNLCGAAGGEALRIWLIRGDTSRVASNFSKLEANAEADLNLPVATELFLRRARQSAKN